MHGEGRVAAAVFGRDDDDAVQRTGAVDGSRAGIFQNLDVLDVRRVQTGDGRADQRDGIPGSELIEGEMHEIFVHRAVNHPKRLHIPQDRGAATDVNARRRPESARNVLDVEAGDAAFEHAAHVVEAFEAHIAHFYGRGRAGIDAVFHLLIAGHHHFVEAVRVFFEADAQRVRAGDAHTAGEHAQVGDEQRFAHGACRNPEGKSPFVVGKGV